MDTDDDMPEDEFLEMPEQALPGDLSRVWAIRSNLRHEREADELSRELAGDAPARMIFPWTDPHERRRIEEKRRREQLAYEEEMIENEQRRDRLLRRIDEEQAEIDERRREIEDNALRLRDGRRAYVDGDRYRDGEGRVLTGADEAEAARLHEDNPAASSWRQKQEADRQAQEARTLKEKIIRDQQEGNTEEAVNRLTGHEKEFTQQAQERAAQTPVDFGGADYMADFAGPAGGEGKTAAVAFAAAAKGYENDPREAIVEIAQPQTTKNAPQPQGQGAKLKI